MKTREQLIIKAKEELSLLLSYLETPHIEAITKLRIWFNIKTPEINIERLYNKLKEYEDCR